MTDEELLACLEALLFASGKPVSYKLLEEILEIGEDKLKEIALVLTEKLNQDNSGLQIIEINDGYQMATKEKYYEKVCLLLDNRPKPSLSQAAMEVLAIMAYNPKITRAEIEKIRGVSSDSAINKLIEYGLIEESGRLDTIGRPMTFKTSDEFLRLFGYKSLQDMPELPRIAEEDPQIQIEGMSEENAENAEETASEEQPENTSEVPNIDDTEKAEEEVLEEQVDNENAEQEMAENDEEKPQE